VQHAESEGLPGREDGGRRVWPVEEVRQADAAGFYGEFVDLGYEFVSETAAGRLERLDVALVDLLHVRP
jgi:hypothetical protein